MCVQEEDRLKRDKMEVVNLVHLTHGKKNGASGSGKPFHAFKSSNASAKTTQPPPKGSQNVKVNKTEIFKCYFCKKSSHMKNDYDRYKRYNEAGQQKGPFANYLEECGIMAQYTTLGMRQHLSGLGPLKLVTWHVTYLLGVACVQSVYDELSRAQIGFLLDKVSHWVENLFGPNRGFFGPQQPSIQPDIGSFSALVLPLDIVSSSASVPPSYPIMNIQPSVQEPSQRSQRIRK
ncbi:unnamed protein product, partial [Prunus brigantina]